MPKTWETRATFDPTTGNEAPTDVPDAPDPLIGALVADRYRVEKRLGEGGIGRVYRAIQEPLGRPIALKVLHEEHAARGDMHIRFEREARAASRLSHPGAVMVFDFGRWNDMLYLAMELVDGRGLDRIMAAEAPLAVARIVDLGAQLCDALEAAHAIGLLHRDLKPENVLVTRAVDGREIAKVCDYGLAYIMGETGTNEPRLTREGTVAGTPGFMAPEQIMNKPLDQRTDLYALGCVLYEMVSLRLPFEGDSSMEILTKQLYDDAEPPSKKAPWPIPRELEQAIMWALQKVPANRPQHASELKAALLAAAGARGEAPSLEEVQVLFDRGARAEAAGIVHGPAPTRSSNEAPAPGVRVVRIVAPVAIAFERSAVPVLRASGASVVTTKSFVDAEVGDAIVLDVRGDAAGGLAALVAHLGKVGDAAKATIVVVGPDDDFTTMTKALELKVGDYVPESLLSSLPKKLTRALDRATKQRDVRRP